MSNPNRKAPGEARKLLSDHLDTETGEIDGRLGEPSLPTTGRGTSPRCPTFYTYACATFFRRANMAAFSLLELLVVIAIISVVSTLAITSISGIQRSTAMTSSASQLLDYLATGRQTAMTLNQQVKIWICPGATNDFVLLYRTTNGTDFNIAAEHELKLNERVTLTSNTAWSSLLGIATAGTETNKGRGAGYSFRFMPDGSTDLAGSPSPTLTLVYRTDAVSATLPANFFTLQIDQQTGTVRTFRPQ